MLIKPVWLFLENDIQEKIGDAEFGLYAALFSLGYLFLTLADFGINQYITKKLASDRNKLQEIFSNVFSFKLYMLIIYPVFMLMVGMVLGYEERELHFLAVLSFAQALLQLIFFFRANLQAAQYFLMDGIASIADKFFLVLMVLAMFSFKTNLQLFVYIRMFSLLISAILLYILVIKCFGFIKPHLQSRKLISLMKWSFPFALITILYSINEKVDQVMIERLSSQTSAGVYAAAYRWMDAFMMYLWTILPIFFAKFARHLKQPDIQQKFFNFGHVITSVPMSYVCVFIFFYGDKLFFQFETNSVEQIAQKTEVLKIIFIAVFLQGIFALYSTLLTATGHELQVSKMIVGSILINIILNYIYIPVYGAIAAAWVTVISTLFLSMSYLLYIHFKLPLKVPYHILFRLAIVYSVFMFTFLYLNNFSKHESAIYLEWYWVSIISGLVLLVSIYFSGLTRILLQKNGNHS
ncbi:MAG: oligosaccharide flippase family protein [Cytophagaceae bacterium]|nr:oligosaccharide flippase family protein [Cytophagaceae bacterium]MDW8455830.1 oligosaccharide flippase family protein [Cytophagaceae bacterium]